MSCQETAAICPLWGIPCDSGYSGATCDSWGRDMDCWSCLLSLLLSLFMTWILKLKGGLRVQVENGMRWRSCSLAVSQRLYSPQAFGNIMLWHKNKPQKKPQTKTAALVDGETNPIWKIYKFWCFIQTWLYWLTLLMLTAIAKWIWRD